jgi:hypothetical protein
MTGANHQWKLGKGNWSQSAVLTEHHTNVIRAGLRTLATKFDEFVHGGEAMDLSR